jgi:hypothetical protein
MASGFPIVDDDLPPGFRVETPGGDDDLPPGFRVEEAQPQRNYSLSQTGISAASNFLPDLGDLGAELYKGVTDNPGEFLKAIPKTVVGMAQQFVPGQQEYETQYADPLYRQVGRSLGFKPASEGEGQNLEGVGFPNVNWDYEQAKRNVAERPAHTALDVASVTPFVPGRAGAVSRAVNPLTPVAKGITSVAKTAGKVTDKARELPVVGETAAAVTKVLNPRLAAIRELPDSAEFAKRSSDIYDAARAQGVDYTPTFWQRMNAGLEQKLKDEGYNPARHPDAARELALIKSQLPTSKPNPMSPITGAGPKTTAAGNMTLDALEQTRSEIGRKARDLRKANNTTDARQLEIMQSYMDDFLDAPVRPGDVIGGADPKTAIKLLEDARGVYKQKVKSQKLDELFYQAELDAGANYTQAGLEHALRRRFRGVLSSKHERKGWSRDELAAMEAVVGEGKVSRSIGKLAPTGALSKALIPTAGMALGGGVGFLGGGLAGAAVAGPAVAAALPAIGAVGRNIATKRTMGAAENVRGVVAGGKLGSQTHPATAAVGAGLAIGTSAENRDRKANLDFAEKTLGPAMMGHVKKTPSLRPLLNNWLSSKASGSGADETARALAQAIATEVNQPDLADRIFAELQGQR